MDETVTNLEEAVRIYLAESGERSEAAQSIVELREIEVRVA